MRIVCGGEKVVTTSFKIFISYLNGDFVILVYIYVWQPGKTFHMVKFLTYTYIFLKTTRLLEMKLLSEIVIHNSITLKSHLK